MIKTTFEIGIEMAPGAVPPDRKTFGSSGYDLCAYGQFVTIPPGGRALIRTGIKFKMPLGCEGQIRSRSGLALKHGIMVLNSPGTIDSDYAEEVGVILYNAGETEYTVSPLDRIAQIVFSPVALADFYDATVVPTTDRVGGFGSTGT